MARRDYYEVLGIGRDADADEVKRAYRNVAMKYHPDRNPGDSHAVERMKEINEAYAVLCDNEKRSRYDTYGYAGLEGYTQADIFRGVDFFSLFHEFGLRDFFGFGGDLFEGVLGGSAARRGRRKGADLRYDLSVTLEEAAFGTEKTIELPVKETCPVCGGTGAKPGGIVGCERCGGTGHIIREHRTSGGLFRHVTTCDKCRGVGKIVKDPCPECEGTGHIEKVEEVGVKVPAGADSGYTARFEGKGERGAAPGDLYVVLNVEKHAAFERHGDDVYRQEDIAFTTAVLGGRAKVSGLDGDIELEIPEGTQTGAVFRTVGRGVPHLDGRGRGDLYVVLRATTPTNLSQREKELLKEFERSRQEGDPERKELGSASAEKT